MYSMPLTFTPRWYTAHVAASTSPASGARPSAFQRRLHDRAVLAAEILEFRGRSVTMSRLGSASSTTWPRLAHSLAARCTASRHSGCNLTPRWSFSIRAILSLRVTRDGFEEGALLHRCGIGVAELHSGGAIEHAGRVAHAAADHMSGRQPTPSFAGVWRHRYPAA